MSSVDAGIAYNCQSSGETRLAVVWSALCVPAMELNLIPQLIPREARLILNDIPTIHFENPSVEDRSPFDEESGLRIPFTLNGTFLTFASLSLNEQEILSAEDYKTVFLTLDFSWRLSSTSPATGLELR